MPVYYMDQNISIRPMKPQEAKEVQRLGRLAFMGLESLFISRPKEAMVALDGERIVGAGIMKHLKGGAGQTIGDFSAAFVDPAYTNRGIGGNLYKAATERFWERGCNCITGQVKSDNVASWSLLEKIGYQRTGIREVFRHLGLRGSISLLLGTPVPFASGMDFYFISRQQPIQEKKSSSVTQMVLFVLLNLLLSCVMLVNRPLALGWFLLAYASLLGADVLFSRIGAGFDGRKWNFRMTNCGFLVTALIPLLGAVFPMIGNWMPASPELSVKLRKALGFSALASWALLILVVILSGLYSERHIYVQYLSYLGGPLLFYRLVPLYPFGDFGSLRVYRMSKVAYALMALLSLSVLFLL